MISGTKALSDSVVEGDSGLVDVGQLDRLCQSIGETLDYMVNYALNWRSLFSHAERELR